MKFLRWLFYGVILVLLVVVALYAVVNLNSEKIRHSLNEELAKSLNGEVNIGGLDFTLFDPFPGFTISLSDVSLKGPQFDKYHKEFFRSEKILVHVELWQLIRGRFAVKYFTIRNTALFAFRASDGFSNLNAIIKKKEKPAISTPPGGGPSLDLSKVILENLSALYVDSVKGKLYGVEFKSVTILIDVLDSLRMVSLSGPMKFKGLMLNQVKGSYLENKEVQAQLNLELPAGGGLTIRPSTLQFEKSTVQLDGDFDFKGNMFRLNIHSPNLNYQEGTTIVTRALREKLGKFDFDRPLELDVRLDGSLAGGEPKIDIAFSTSANEFKTGKIHIRNLSLKGNFINHIDSLLERNDTNSGIRIDEFNGSFSGIPSLGKLSIVNLNDPELTLDSHSVVELQDLNSQTDTTRLRFLSGHFEANVNYKGRLKEYLNDTITSYSGVLNGSAALLDGSWEMPQEQKKFTGSELSVHFNEKELVIEKIRTAINGSPVELNGKVVGFVPFFFQPREKGTVKLSVYSPHFDLGPLVKKKKKVRISEKERRARQKRMNNFVDVLNHKVEFDLDVTIDELIRGPMKATQFVSKVRFAKNRFSADPIRMKLAGGSIKFALTVSDLDKDLSPVSFRGDIQRTDVRKLFASFNNFSLKAVRSENVRGTLSSTIRVRGKIDDQLSVVGTSLRGNVKFSLKKGELIQFEPLEKMSNFLFKNRDFSDVQFAEIKGDIDLRGNSFDIHRMEVQSSVLTLFVEGTYSVKDSTDLSIQVPLSNLKKRKKDFKPQNVGPDAKVGPSVFLHVYSKKGETAIGYDPFKKFKKK